MQLDLLAFALNFFSSVLQLCLSLCNAIDCSMPGFSIHCQLPELAQAHDHRLGDAIQPSHPLFPLLLIPSISLLNLALIFLLTVITLLWLPRWLYCKEPSCQCRRGCRIDPWVGRSPGGGNGNILQYCCPENSIDSLETVYVV